MSFVAALRLFLAAPVAPAVEEGIAKILAKMSSHQSVRWVSRSQLHITLRFIGDFDETLLPKLEEGLKETAFSAEPFEAQIGGLGAFPRMERPRVLFIPVLKGKEALGGLERKLSALLEGFGVKPDDKEYHPHLTLGRVRENENPVEALSTLRGTCPAQFGPWKVDRFILFKSELTPDGPLYTHLRELEFGKR